MSLIFDRRKELAGKPACHALILGISNYDNLGVANGPPGEFDLFKLASPALTAFRIWQWLEKHKNDLSVKLATCRLLLAPSPEEVAVEPALNNWPYGCKFDNFSDAAIAWREDCSSCTDNLAAFYFAGHGIQRTLEDSILLMQDFAPAGGNPLDKTASVNNIFAGMAPNAGGDMALSQIYFIDACRNFPEKLRDFDILNPRQVFAPKLGGKDKRHAPIFFAALPDTSAYARKGMTTVFGDALLECLDVAATACEDAAGNVVYDVGSEALEDCLIAHFDALTPQEKSDQEIVPGVGLPKNVKIHRLGAAPTIPVTIVLNPSASFGAVEFTLENGAGLIQTYPRTVPVDLPIKIPLPMGIYKLTVKPMPPITVSHQKMLMVGPPRFTWLVRSP